MPVIDQNQGTVSSALLVLCHLLHSPPPIRDPTREKRPSSPFHLTTTIYTYTYNVFLSDFFPNTRRNYRLIVTCLRRSTVFLPTSLMQVCRQLPLLYFPENSRMIVTYFWRSTFLIPPHLTQFRHRLPTLSNQMSSQLIVA